MGLSCIISKSDKINIQNLAKNSYELAIAIEKEIPDVVILDYNSQGKFCVTDIDCIKKEYPTVNFVIISSDNDKDNIHKILLHEGVSFLTKECDEDEIIGAIVSSSKNERFLCNKIVNIILEKNVLSDKEEDCSATNLSTRELEVINLTAKGHSAKQIADKLYLSTHTVYTHKKNIMRKLNVNSSSELIIYAINNGLVIGIPTMSSPNS